MRSGVHSDSLSVQRRLSHHGQAGQLLVTPSSWLALMLKVSDLVCCSTAHQELMHNAALPAHIRRNSLCSASDLGAEAAHAVRQPASSQAQGGAYWFGDLSCQAVSDSRRGVRRVRCRLPPPTDQRCTVPVFLRMPYNPRMRSSRASDIEASEAPCTLRWGRHGR